MLFRSILNHSFEPPSSIGQGGGLPGLSGSTTKKNPSLGKTLKHNPDLNDLILRIIFFFSDNVTRIFNNINRVSLQKKIGDWCSAVTRGGKPEVPGPRGPNRK